MQARITITSSTVKQLQEQLHAARGAGNQELFVRILAVLLFAQARDVAEICQLLSVAQSSFYEWLHALLQAGVDGLRPRHSPGRKPKLSAEQKSRLRELLLAGPEAAGFACGCWNAALVQLLIAQQFQVNYNQHYICALLAGLGFSYQKARFVAEQRDEEARQAWLCGLWPQLAQAAWQQDAWLLFGDEASFAWWGSLGYTWAPVGQQPQVKTSGRRKGYKVFGLLEWFSGQLFWAGQEGRFNAESYCQFLGQVLSKTRRRVILIHDGAPYHRAAYTKEWLRQHAHRVTVYQLPSYSPDYNPIEHVWRYVKEGTHNSYFALFSDLTARVEERLGQLGAKPARVHQLMGTPLDDVAGVPARAA